ncbi:MAG: hypothetical protein ABIS74_03245 [Ferruginibacter sp.]
MLQRIFIGCLFIFFFTACSYITITPRSKRNIYRERPSTLLLEKIIEFRLEQLGWPRSKQDFMSKGRKYYQAFDGFKYHYTDFMIVDSNKMIFSFSHHSKDADPYIEPGLININSYQGHVKFYKVNDKFVWKLRMR